jgi:CSLREA domain-containing protein
MHNLNRNHPQQAVVIEHCQKLRLNGQDRLTTSRHWIRMNQTLFNLSTRAAFICVALSNYAGAQSVANDIQPKISHWVTKTADTLDGSCDDDCSLREAIAAANTNESIGFSAAISSSKQSIVLSRGELVIAKDINLIGPGNWLNISANRASRVLQVKANVVISNVSFSGGQVYGADNGGAIANEGDLDLRNVRVFNSHTEPSGSGGGIWNAGRLRLTDCEVSFNESGDGGGIYSNGALSVLRSNVHDNFATNGAGVFADDHGALTNVEISGSTIQHNAATDFGAGIYLQAQRSRVVNTTINGNVAREGGAGIYVSSIDTNRDLQLVNSTLSGNVAGGVGAGVLTQATGSGRINLEITSCTLVYNTGGGLTARGMTGGIATSIMRNTIFSHNSGGNLDLGGESQFISGGHNLSNDATSLYLTQSTDRLASNPQLGALSDNGGTTFTHAPSNTSPAVNTGFNYGQKSDQRGVGFFRTMGRPSSLYSDGTDIGAFEVQFSK